MGAGGARKIHEWELSPAEQAAVVAAAELVRGAVESLGGVRG
jgi:hypothetical protein